MECFSQVFAVVTLQTPAENSNEICQCYKSFSTASADQLKTPWLLDIFLNTDLLSQPLQHITTTFKISIPY
jgi:hypothetical protein